MSDKKVKDKELKNVSGGWLVEEDHNQCPKCGKTDDNNEMLVRSEKKGCSVIYHYKCIYCGHEWEN